MAPRADEITLRDYRASDLDVIFRLDEICFSAEFRFDRRSMRSFAERRNAIVIVAEDDCAQLVAFIIVQLEWAAGGLRGYVVTLDVAVAWRHLGIAERLMKATERRAEMAGAKAMDLHVFVGNQEAIRFYRRLGYAQIGELPGFYGSSGLDAYLYRKALT